jgi:hypothetical protein
MRLRRNAKKKKGGGRRRIYGQRQFWKRVCYEIDNCFVEYASVYNGEGRVQVKVKIPL